MMKIFVVLLCFAVSSLFAASPVTAAEAVSEVGDIPASAGLHFVDIAWADEIYGFRSYDPNPEGIFDRGTRGYVYMELAGFQSDYDEETDSFFIDVAVDIRLRTVFGITLMRETEVIEVAEYSTFERELIWFYIWVEPPSWSPRGTYTAEVTVRDRLAGTELVRSEEVTLR